MHRNGRCRLALMPIMRVTIVYMAMDSLRWSSPYCPSSDCLHRDRLHCGCLPGQLVLPRLAFRLSWPAFRASVASACLHRNRLHREPIHHTSIYRFAFTTSFFLAMVFIAIVSNVSSSSSHLNHDRLPRDGLHRARLNAVVCAVSFILAVICIAMVFSIAAVRIAIV